MITRGWGLLILLSSCLLFPGCAEKEPEYPLLNGQTFRFSELHGKLVLINYWATWCKPCREEIPELNRFAKDNSGQVAVFGFNYDGVSGEELGRQVTAMGIEFPTLLEDPKQRFSLKPSGVLPETLVFDRQGGYLKTLIGPQTYADLEGLLDASSER